MQSRKKYIQQWENFQKTEFKQTSVYGESHRIFDYIKSDNLDAVKREIIRDAKASLKERFSTQIDFEGVILSPLFIAAWYGKTKMVEYILKNMERVDIHNQTLPALKWTALTVAVLRGHLAVVDLLMTHGFPQIKPDDSNLWHLAAFAGNTDILQLLKERAIEGMDAENNDNDLPLDTAARCNRVTCVSLLLEFGATFSEGDGHKHLVTASQNGQIDLMKVLLKHDPQGAAFIHSIIGWTPLMAAAWSGKNEAVQVLLECKADITCQSTNEFLGVPVGFDAAGIARKKRHPLDFVKLLCPKSPESTAKKELTFTSQSNKNDDMKEPEVNYDTIGLDLLPGVNEIYQKAVALIKKIGKRGEQYVYDFLKEYYKHNKDCTSFNENTSKNRFTVQFKDKSIQLTWLNHPKEQFKPYDMELIISLNGKIIYHHYIEIKSSSRKPEEAKAFISENEWNKMLECNQKISLPLVLDQDLHAEIKDQACTKNITVEELCQGLLRLGLEADKRKNQLSLEGEALRREQKQLSIPSYKQQSSYTLFFVADCGEHSKPVHTVIAPNLVFMRQSKTMRIVPFGGHQDFGNKRTVPFHEDSISPSPISSSTTHNQEYSTPPISRESPSLSGLPLLQLPPSSSAPLIRSPSAITSASSSNSPYGSLVSPSRATSSSSPKPGRGTSDIYNALSRHDGGIDSSGIIPTRLLTPPTTIPKLPRNSNNASPRRSMLASSPSGAHGREKLLIPRAQGTLPLTNREMSTASGGSVQVPDLTTPAPLPRGSTDHLSRPSALFVAFPPAASAPPKIAQARIGTTEVTNGHKRSKTQ